MKILYTSFIVFWFSCTLIKKNEPTLKVSPMTLCGTLTSDMDWYATHQHAPLLEGLGSLNYKITTANPLVQQYFNQGLKLAYAFNHAEAARSFYTAIQIDSTCAMCHWGFAYVLGPNYNAGMEPDNYTRAYAAVQKAIQWSGDVSKKEKELITALSSRYVKEPVENRYSLDSTYSRELTKLFAIYPNDPEIAALYVESILDLHPWDLWDKQGQPKAWTPEIISILENLLKQFPDHPGLNHFYIHAVEASNQPEKGLKSANLFDQGLMPGAGHLVHMPSHIYIRTGDYHQGSLANINAVKIDSQYVETCHAQGIYPLAYFPHNFHFLAATATFEGNRDWALMGAEKVRAHANTALMKDPNWATLQHYYLIPYFVKVKFGLWDSILATPESNDSLAYIKSIRSFARGMAFLGKGDLVKAKAELTQIETTSTDSTLIELTIWGINSVKEIVDIAAHILKGEILAKEGDFASSIKLLREAVAMEDQLNYNEPPDWFFSVRHHLGAVLLENKNYEEAIKVYQEDLKWLPKNGWAQHGLKKAYTELKDEKSLNTIINELQQSWKYADIHLQTSRIL